jgi:hypothetical protein
MTKLQKTIFFLVAWIASIGLMVVQMGLHINFMLNTRLENVAALLGGVFVLVGLQFLIYMTGFRVEISWEKK